MDLLTEKVFTPLQMKSVTNTDAGRCRASDPTRYMRYALGPLHPAPKEGQGWMFAAGELAMTPSDLGEVGHRDHGSERAEAGVIPRNGNRSRYSRTESAPGTVWACVSAATTGIARSSTAARSRDFTAENIVLPDDKIAVAVLTNQDASEAAGAIGRQVVAQLVQAATPQDPKADSLMRQVYDGLQQGKIDRSLFTDNCNAYFTDASAEGLRQ